MICGLQIQQITTEQSDPRLPLVNSSLSLKLQILISHDKALHAGRVTPTFWWQELSQQRPNLHLSSCRKYMNKQQSEVMKPLHSFEWYPWLGSCWRSLLKPQVQTAPAQQNSRDTGGHPSMRNIQKQPHTYTAPNTRKKQDFFHPFTRCKWKYPNWCFSEQQEGGGERRKRKEELRNRKVAQWLKKIAMNIDWCFLPVSGF